MNRLIKEHQKINRGNGGLRKKENSRVKRHQEGSEMVE
jgi:hypothetical protein